MYHSETLNGTALAIMKGEKGNKDEYILDRVSLPDGHAQLQADIEYGDAQFYWRKGSSDDWQKLGPKIDISFMSDEQTGGFTGLMGGIGAWDAYRRQSFADFKNFKITPKK
nr:hypothetical protein [Lentilactobacillus kisonensis]